MGRSTRLAALVLLSAAPTAFAAGFYFGDNGAKATAQGGAFTGQADDLTALMYNPAGLAKQDGVGFDIHLALMNHEVTFLRQDVGFDPANPATKLAQQVGNTAGLFPLPFAAVSYGFPVAGRRLTLGLGAYGPPGVGRYAFPEPDYTKDAGKYVHTPLKYAPQRYALINNDILIYYPTLAVAYDLHPMVQVGVSLQVVGSSFMFRQALYSGVIAATKQTEEDPIFDSVAKVTLQGKPGFTAIGGVMVRPNDRLSIGASLRPAIQVNASGTLDITLGEAAKGLNTVVNGNKADLSMTLPLEARLGVAYRPIDKLNVAADFVYQGWNSFDAITLTPQGVTMTIGAGEPQVVQGLKIPKNWVASYSGRLGASYDIIPLLTARLGFLYETGASPEKYFAIDFAHPTRFFLTGGLTAHVSSFDVTLSGLWTPTQTVVVQNSDQRQGQTDPTVAGSVIGNGLYTSGGWVASLGVRGHFGGEAKAAAKEESPPAPAPVPVPAATPAAAPAAAPDAPAATPAP